MAEHTVPFQAFRQAVLPLRMGGLGLTSAVDVHLPAYLGSLVASAPLIQIMPLSVPVPDGLVSEFFSSSGVPVTDDIKSLFDLLKNAGARIQSQLSGLVFDSGHPRPL